MMVGFEGTVEIGDWAGGKDLNQISKHWWCCWSVAHIVGYLEQHCARKTWL